MQISHCCAAGCRTKERLGIPSANYKFSKLDECLSVRRRWY